IHTRIENKNDPLLRRPFSIRCIEDEKIEILYKVVGKGTKILARKKAGEKIDLLGPLGQKFKINPGIKRAILVAGGVGIAPLYFLASRLVTTRTLEISVFIGAESKEKLLCEEEFKSSEIKVQVATEDGSKGFKGLVSDLFANWTSAKPHTSSTVVYACGPSPMLKKIAFISNKGKIPCYVSLEQRMGCGIGACLGCAIKGKNGYLRVCKDGPVFDARQIDWEIIE
ncbi:MAG: dihydroorotate dehydrogenase electron transfer subunit, partial [Candidatus Aerophobetes bacterium]|nr:dihydroorotate dehydrogenase electron transfer subunit [Candidatus Aerophobetes bacterium]